MDKPCCTIRPFRWFGSCSCSFCDSFAAAAAVVVVVAFFGIDKSCNANPPGARPRRAQSGIVDGRDGCTYRKRPRHCWHRTRRVATNWVGSCHNSTHRRRRRLVAFASLFPEPPQRNTRDRNNPPHNDTNNNTHSPNPNYPRRRRRRYCRCCCCCCRCCCCHCH